MSDTDTDSDNDNKNPKKPRLETSTYDTQSTANMTESQYSQDTIGSLLPKFKSSSTDDDTGSLYMNALHLFIQLTNDKTNPEPNPDEFNDIGNHCYNIVMGSGESINALLFTLSVIKDGIEIPDDDCDDVAASASAGAGSSKSAGKGSDYGFGGNVLFDDSDSNPYINKILTTLFLSLFHYHKPGTSENGGGTFCNIRLFLKGFLEKNNFEEEEIRHLIESLDVYADNFISELNNVKEDETTAPEKSVRGGGMFSCAGISDIGPIPKFNVMKFMRVIMVGILFYAVRMVVVNRMTRFQNQKILISNNGFMKELRIDLDIKDPFERMADIQKCVVSSMFENGISTEDGNININDVVNLFKTGINLENGNIPPTIIKILKLTGYANIADIVNNIKDMHECIKLGGSYYYPPNTAYSKTDDTDYNTDTVKQIGQSQFISKETQVGVSPFNRNPVVVYIKDINFKNGISDIITKNVMKSIESTLEIQNTPTDKTNELLAHVLTASNSFTVNKSKFMYIISNYIKSVGESAEDDDAIAGNVVDYIMKKLFNTENDEAFNINNISMESILNTANIFWNMGTTLTTTPAYVEFRRNLVDTLKMYKRKCKDASTDIGRTAEDSTETIKRLYEDLVVLIQIQIDIFMFSFSFILITFYCFFKRKHGSSSADAATVGMMSILTRSWGSVFAFVIYSFIEEILKPDPPEKKVGKQSATSYAEPADKFNDTGSDEPDQKMEYSNENQLQQITEPTNQQLSRWFMDNLRNAGDENRRENVVAIRDLLAYSSYLELTDSADSTVNEPDSEMMEVAEVLLSFRTTPYRGDIQRGGKRNYNYKRSKTPRNSKTKRCKKTFRLFKNRRNTNKKNRTIKKNKKRTNKTTKSYN